MAFKIPILLITFNRPETTKIVLEAIRAVNPEKVYFFSDAPRTGNDDDLVQVTEVRKCLNEVDWKTDVLNNFQSDNLGCARGVTTAINWAFENEEQLIILEDDCLPHNSFFQYCEIMLNKYKNSYHVMHVSGARWNPEFRTDESYLFSAISHVWGWATWKRAWTRYDYELIDWKKNAYKINESLKDYFSVLFWKYLFKSISNSNYKHTWDYQWQYTLFKEKGLCIVPDVNLISNIGLQGTHARVRVTITKNEKYVFNNSVSKWILKKAPLEIKQNLEYDRYQMKNHFLKYVSKINACKLALSYFLKYK